MFSSSRKLVYSFTLFKRAFSTQDIEVMLAAGRRLTGENKFSDAKQVYEKIMERFPARHEGYDGYLYVEALTSGIFGPSQRLIDHFQKKYLDAVEKEQQLCSTNSYVQKR